MRTLQQQSGSRLIGDTSNNSSAGNKITLALLAILAVIIFGSIGFMLIEEMNPMEALYMTVITLSTVGFSEVHPLSQGGRLLTMLVIAFGVGLGAYFATTLGQFVLEGQIKEMFGRKKMDNRIKKLNGHAIIAGFGRVGCQVANEFARTKEPFLVVEKSAETVERLVNSGFLYIHGEATEDYILEQAGIDRASTLVSTLPDEAHNVYLTLTARHMNRDLNIIARADYEGGETKLIRAGANHVVSPHVLGGIRMAMSALRPNVGDFMHMTTPGAGDLSIEEMVVPEGSVMVGQSIAESKIKQGWGITIIGLKRPGGTITITPGPEVILKGGDTLILIGINDKMEKLYTFLNE